MSKFEPALIKDKIPKSFTVIKYINMTMFQFSLFGEKAEELCLG